MMLSDVDIIKAVKAGEITLSGFERKRVQPASYDILLGNRFVLTDENETFYIDPVRKKFAKTHEIIIPDGEEFILHPGVSVLGTSRDYMGSDTYLLQLGGKSSLARIGLLVHNTAGIINPGHFLHITLELCNLNNVPIVLRPGMEIAQVMFSPLSSPHQTSYKDVGRFAENNWEHYKPPKRRKASSKKK